MRPADATRLTIRLYAALGAAAAALAIGVALGAEAQADGAGAGTAAYAVTTGHAQGSVDTVSAQS